MMIMVIACFYYVSACMHDVCGVVYVCMYACMYACMYVCMYVCMHAHGIVLLRAYTKFKNNLHFLKSVFETFLVTAKNNIVVR